MPSTTISLAVNHHHASKPKPPLNQPVLCFNRKPKEQREKREQKTNEKKREKFSEEMRRERKKSKEIAGLLGGVRAEEINFLIFTKCTVAFHFLRATVHFVKKFEVEEEFYSTAETLFFILLSTNRDT